MGLLTSWAVIVLCQLKLHRQSRSSGVERPAFRMPGSPWTGYLTLGFLGAVGVLIVLDWPTGTLTVGLAGLVVVPLLVVGWFAVRDRLREPVEGGAGELAPDHRA